jgi:hypothetical protein
MNNLMSTQTNTLKLVPHEPCWLLSGVSRCECLDHVTVTVTALCMCGDGGGQSIAFTLSPEHQGIEHSRKLGFTTPPLGITSCVVDCCCLDKI